MEKSRLVDIEYTEAGEYCIVVQRVGHQAHQRYPLSVLLQDKACLKTLPMKALLRIQVLVTDAATITPLMKLQFWVFCKLESLSRTMHHWEDEATAYVLPSVDEEFHDW